MNDWTASVRTAFDLDIDEIRLGVGDPRHRTPPQNHVVTCVSDFGQFRYLVSKSDFSEVVFAARSWS